MAYHSRSDARSSTQATTFLQIETAALTEPGKDVAHLLSLLPNLRCVGMGGDRTSSPESWAAVMPSLSACQDLRFSGERGGGTVAGARATQLMIMCTQFQAPDKLKHISGGSWRVAAGI